ncbi:hypothetical protein [Conchiformibius kuhniae]|uniref:Uncharacterized protein n=1 Tax=Conchiformibius kuhniae TaxID=211502 RepID=A0A8T9MZU6_9NEIS|nr:hypothetical protein [Conchiformibius kuhniae]UOP05303.1 hypothetical protein LVJ77_03625 [Conchiformibius kuhniae]
MSQAKLSDQLGWCITSKDHLQNLSDAVQVSANNLDNIIQMMHQSSFAEYNALLLPIRERFNQGSTETQKFIAEHHLAYLERQAKRIVAELNGLG